jgi:succinyl-diaminopimelate desuccinylase
VQKIPDTQIVSTFSRPPAVVDPDSIFVRALSDATAPHHQDGATSVGRDGASDVVSFLRAGVPAVEFGPVGGGHHGPEEWVSVSSLDAYRGALTRFVTDLPGHLEADAKR